MADVAVPLVPGVRSVLLSSPAADTINIDVADPGHDHDDRDDHDDLGSDNDYSHVDDTGNNDDGGQTDYNADDDDYV